MLLNVLDPAMGHHSMALILQECNGFIGLLPSHLFCRMPDLSWWKYILQKFWRYNKASLGELVPLEILGKFARFNSESLAKISPSFYTVSTVHWTMRYSSSEVCKGLTKCWITLFYRQNFGRVYFQSYSWRLIKNYIVIRMQGSFNPQMPMILSDIYWCHGMPTSLHDHCVKCLNVTC